MNIFSAPNQLADDECLGLANIVLDEEGGGSKRRGLTVISDPGAEILSIYVYYRGSVASPQVVVHLVNGKVRYSTNGGTSWTDMITGVDVTNPMSWETFAGNLYFCNGVDSFFKWDGSTATAIASAPKGRFLKSYKDSMWVAGAAGTADDRVWASDPGTAESWSVSNWVDIAKGDGDQMRGLATDGVVLICNKRRRGFVIYDPVTFANRMFDPDKGCESHNSFVHWGENLYYVTHLGVAVFLGDAPSQIVSRSIDPIFTPDIADPGTGQNIWAYTHNNRIGWTMSDLQVGGYKLQIEMLPGSDKHPFTFHRMPMRCFATYQTGSVEQLIGGMYGATKLVQVFSGPDDNGVTFSGVIETKWFDCGDPYAFKYLRRMILTARGTFFVEVFGDFNTGVKKVMTVAITAATGVWNDVGDVWGNENWGGTGVLEVARLHPDEYARHFKFRFSDQISQDGLQVIDVGDVDYQLKKGQWALLGGLMHTVGMGTDL